MKLRKTLCLLTLLVCSTAYAEFELKTLISAVEASPGNIILPATTNGMVTYRGCSDECDKEYERARLTEGTSFTVDGAAMKFSEFLRIHASQKRSEEAYALVTVDLQLGTVTEITLAL